MGQHITDQALPDEDRFTRRKRRLSARDHSTGKKVHPAFAGLLSRAKNTESVPASAPNERAAQDLRAAELAAWQTDPEIQRLRVILLILCWAAAVLFVAIPAGFCLAYTSFFTDQYTIQWIQE